MIAELICIINLLSSSCFQQREMLMGDIWQKLEEPPAWLLPHVGEKTSGYAASTARKWLSESKTKLSFHLLNLL